MTWTRLLFIFLIGYGAFHYVTQREIEHGPGVLVAEEPYQGSAGSAAEQTISGFQVTPLAAFSIRARVLASKGYYFEREADLSPVDLALGWGRMSDEDVLKDISISQGGRFYYWHVNNFPIPREEIQSHSANMHMIPADANVRKTLQSIKAGNIVRLQGYLVEAKTADGWRWKSSLTREDSGSGACELVLVQSVEVL
ncbi:MAG TPA: hypothetical protein VIO56_04210 [Methylotenera sp.]